MQTRAEVGGKGHLQQTGQPQGMLGTVPYAEQRSPALGAAQTMASYKGGGQWGCFFK